MKLKPKQIEEAIKRVSNTDDGRVMLFYLMTECGYNKNLVNINDPTISHFHAVKRGVYASMRNFIDNINLKKIEFDFEIEVENGRSGSSTRSKHIKRDK